MDHMEYDLARYALSMLRLYAGAFVRLGFGEWHEVCLTGCRLARSILQADVTAILLFEGNGYRCAAIRGVPDPIAARWSRPHPLLDHVVSTASQPRVFPLDDPALAEAAAVLGLHGTLLAVPLPNIDRSGGYSGISLASGPWRGNDIDLTLMVLEIMATLLGGAISNCRLRQQYQQIYVNLNEAREAAEEHSRTKNRFLARMSHELRTPLNIIIGYSDLIREELEDTSEITQPAEYVEQIRPIHEAGHHLLAIINDMLDISKLQSREVKLHLEETDFVELLRGTAAEVSVLVKDQNNRLVLDIREPIPAGRTDPRRLRQILYNLLSNACKFTEDGQITVRLWADRGPPGTVTFQVDDDGIGMSPENLERIFDEFVQVDESTTRRHGGTGLGLAVSQALARLLGGRIVAESALGRGSTFTVTILADVTARRERPTADVLMIAPASEEQLTIRRLLEQAGYSVRSSTTVSDGLEVAARTRPALVVLDTSMPGGDGTTIARLKTQEQTRAIPVALLTSGIDLDTTSARADAILVRPVPQKRLLDVVGQLTDPLAHASTLEPPPPRPVRESA